MNTFPSVTDRTEEWPQILAIVVGSFAALTSGLLVGWPTPFIVIITKDKNNYDINEDKAAYMTIISPMFMMLACPVFTKCCDIIGRKRTLLLSAVPYLLSWILKAMATEVYMFYSARVLAGIGDGIVFSALPMYIGEISNPKIRGTWGNIMTIFIYSGQLLINIVAIYFNVQQTSFICLSVIVIFAVVFPLMPESPYYYLIKGDYCEAKNSLIVIRRKDKIEEEFEKLKTDVERQLSNVGTWKDLVMISVNRKALCAGVFLRLSQQFCGMTALYTFSKFIFEKSDSISSDISTVIYFSLSVCLNSITSFTVDYFGRRKPYITSLGLCAIVSAVLSVYFYIHQFVPYVDIKSIEYVPLAGMIAFMVFSSLGVTIIPTLMLGELFSANVKSKGLSVLIIVFGGSVFLTNYIFYSLHANFGMYSPFLFFTICGAISCFLCPILVPETAGKTLTEIQESFEKKKPNTIVTKC